MGELTHCEKSMYKRLESFAKDLRNNPTDVERLLWSRLKSSQVEGVKFRRQQIIEDYIVDFVSFKKKIVIELDGGQHAETSEKDKVRDDCLTLNGYKVLRFWNNEVIKNMEAVLEVITATCLNRCHGSSPTPSPLPSREGEVKEVTHPK